MARVNILYSSCMRAHGTGSIIYASLIISTKLNRRQHAVLTGRQNREMWDHEKGRHTNRQYQETLAILGFRERSSITQAEGPGRKKQEIFLEG